MTLFSNPGRAIAIAQIILCFSASIGYALMKDWRKAAYWFFAGSISITVTI